MNRTNFTKQIKIKALIYVTRTKKKPVEILATSR